MSVRTQKAGKVAKNTAPLDLAERPATGNPPDRPRSASPAFEEVVGALHEASRTGDAAAASVLKEQLQRLMRKATAAHPTASVTPAPMQPAELEPRFAERARAVREGLRASTPDAAADVQLLHDLVADQVGIAAALVDVQTRVAARLPLMLGDPRLARAGVGILRDLLAAHSQVARRVEAGLHAASTLQLQRRMLTNRRGADDV